ncbi:MAG: RNA methyltransferase [Myxococcales bacterium]|nr:RNA methyltransferase [Myxococcales bacterium]
MMTNERRLQRMRDVLEQRLQRVRCAVEAVYHRHNVSAILRTCDALGLHDVHLVGTRKLRVSPGPARGTERWLELHHHEDSADAIRALRAEGVAIWVADLVPGRSVPPEEVPVDRPICLWFGAELLGVSPEARAAADGVVHLPMHGMAQSLNVSVAAALALRPVSMAARALGPDVLLSPERRDSVLASWLAREEARRSRQ